MSCDLSDADPDREHAELAALAELDAITPPPAGSQPITPASLAARQRVRRTRLAAAAAVALLVLIPAATIWADALWRHGSASVDSAQAPLACSRPSASSNASMSRELDQLALRVARLLEQVARAPADAAAARTNAPIPRIALLRYELASARAAALPGYASRVASRHSQPKPDRTIR